VLPSELQTDSTKHACCSYLEDKRRGQEHSWIAWVQDLSANPFE
jgi:hypothetical protein